MSLLKIYDSSKLECQEDGYDSYCYSILQVSGNFIPAWFFKSDKVLTSTEVYLEVLNKTQLSNNTITADSSTEIVGYTVEDDGINIWGEKVAETLASDTVYRLRLILYVAPVGYQYYSEIFKKV